MAVTQKSLLESVPTDLYIGGRWRESSGGTRFDVHDPATGSVLVSVADGTVEDGRAALDALEDAGWDVLGRRPRPSRGAFARSMIRSLAKILR